jgi:hypothetical protein
MKWKDFQQDEWRKQTSQYLRRDYHLNSMNLNVFEKWHQNSKIDRWLKNSSNYTELKENY